MYARVYVCMCLSMYVCMYECMNARVCLCMCGCMYILMCVYVCMYVWSEQLIAGPSYQQSTDLRRRSSSHLISSQSSAAWHGLGPGQCMYGNMVGYHSVLDLPCIHTFIHKCIYMHTYTYIHTYIHTYIVGNPCMYVFMYQCAIISFILTYIHLSVKV